MTDKKKLMFYCQHVLGMGHFIRSVEIVRGLSRFNVFFLNGGERIPEVVLPPEVEVINLPPVKADAEFQGIHAVDGEVDSAMSLGEIMESRKRLLLDQFERILPDALMIELFPFGRLKFTSELIPLLERARASGSRTKIVCSLRDIIVKKREQQQFEEEACRIVNQYFDLVLVHADPRFQRLEESFPRVTDIKRPVRYTGFVAQKSHEFGNETICELLRGGEGEKVILVSIGGGRVGIELIDCAIEASALIAGRLPHRMLIFTGPYTSAAEFQRLQAKISGKSSITLERYTSNFISCLRSADLSLSMAGYNTSMNIVNTGTPAIIYPFTGNNNQEQTTRANKLRELGIVEIINPHELVPEVLAEKMLVMLNRPRSATNAHSIDLNGVAKTAAALAEIVAVNSDCQT